jgi:hypothetical protein
MFVFSFYACDYKESYEFRVYYERGTSKSGDVPVDPKTYNSGDKAVVLDKGTLENDDYTFLGWRVYLNLYQPGDEVSFYYDAYLTAVWDDEVDIFFIFDIEGDEAIITGCTENSYFNVVIPPEYSDKSVAEIANNVFRGMSVENVSMPKNLKRIGAFSFANCRITSLTIPDSVISVGIGAFQENEIKSIRFGTGLTSISKGAFSRNNLLSLSLPENITLIDDGAFFDNKIDQIFIGADVEIGNDTSLGVYGASFKEAYEANGKQAGVYNYTAGFWLLMQ